MGQNSSADWVIHPPDSLMGDTISRDTCKENHWLSLLRKVHFLKLDTGALGKSGFIKGTAIRQKLGNHCCSRFKVLRIKNSVHNQCPFLKAKAHLCRFN